MTDDEDRILLLVEDDADHAALAAHALRRSGLAHALEVASDGETALGFLERQADAGSLPRLVLLDLQLGRLDGLEVLERIRKHARLRRLPVVIMTSSDEDGDIGRAYDIGCNSYVRKPVSFDRYRELVVQLAGYWLQHNVPPRAPDIEAR